MVITADIKGAVSIFKGDCAVHNLNLFLDCAVRTLFLRELQSFGGGDSPWRRLDLQSHRTLHPSFATNIGQVTVMILSGLDWTVIDQG